MKLIDLSIHWEYTSPMKMKRDAVQIVRLATDEKKAFKDAAIVAGVSLSAWIRERLRRAARNELQDADQPVAFLTDVTME